MDLPTSMHVAARHTSWKESDTPEPHVGFQREGEAVRSGKKENASRCEHRSAGRKEVPLPTRVLYDIARSHDVERFRWKGQRLARAADEAHARDPRLERSFLGEHEPRQRHVGGHDLRPPSRYGGRERPGSAANLEEAVATTYRGSTLVIERLKGSDRRGLQCLLTGDDASKQVRRKGTTQRCLTEQSDEVELVKLLFKPSCSCKILFVGRQPQIGNAGDEREAAPASSAGQNRAGQGKLSTAGRTHSFRRPGYH